MKLLLGVVKFSQIGNIMRLFGLLISIELADFFLNVTGFLMRLISVLSCGVYFGEIIL